MSPILHSTSSNKYASLDRILHHSIFIKSHSKKIKINSFHQLYSILKTTPNTNTTATISSPKNAESNRPKNHISLSKPIKSSSKTQKKPNPTSLSSRVTKIYNISKKPIQSFKSATLPNDSTHSPSNSMISPFSMYNAKRQ